MGGTLHEYVCIGICKAHQRPCLDSFRNSTLFRPIGLGCEPWAEALFMWGSAKDN